ncbi:MAG TPA: DEAD/DEAH box helicase, partial [Planctomycetota bacterium]|nr:DEAD/DEAH box helicase [Planctomycetota bacterium]
LDQASGSEDSTEQGSDGTEQACAPAEPVPVGLSVAPDVDADDDANDDTDPDPELGSWGVIPEPLRQAMEAQGYDNLTPVQESAIEALTAGRDLRITSQTGSGKTVALGMVMAPDLIQASLEKRSSKRMLGPIGLVIAPTRELAGQVQRELMWLYKRIPNLRVECVTGGTPFGPEARRLETSPLVLVGTPGRLLDHVKRGSLDLSLVSQLVLDEADQMLDLGFRDELDAILEATPAQRHTHLVSATFPPAIQQLAKRYQENAMHVEGSRLGHANADISHVGYWVGRGDRYPVLVNQLLLAGEERVLVFVATRRDTNVLAEKLSSDGFPAAPLSGDLEQKNRERTLAAFRSGSVRILVATDVAARGLDVPDVPLVVQGDLPRDQEVYIHRSGRTGRAGNKGLCVLLAPSNQRRRVQRLIQDARIPMDWQDAPSAEEVRAALHQRTADTVRQALAEVTHIRPEDRELARQLLEDADAEQVVAVLLSRVLPTQGTAQPFQVQRTERSERPERFERPDRFARPERTERPERVERTEQVRTYEPNPRVESAPPSYTPRTEAPYAAERDVRPHREDAGQTFGSRFSINWGRQQGGNARRILALICRRGGIQSQDVGAIRLGPSSSTFEISDKVAATFEERANKFDPRDPGIRIKRSGNERESHGPSKFEQRGPGGGHGRFGRDPRPERFEREGGRQGFDGGRQGFDGGRQGYDRGHGGFRRGGAPSRGRSVSYQAQDTAPPRHPDEGDGYSGPNMYGRPRFGGGGARRGGGGGYRRGGGRGRGRGRF